VVEGLREMSLYMCFDLGDGMERGIEICGKVRPHGNVVWVFGGREEVGGGMLTTKLECLSERRRMWFKRNNFVYSKVSKNMCPDSPKKSKTPLHNDVETLVP
jgi:hypothetical protein